jgi:hypothetical protein
MTDNAGTFVRRWFGVPAETGWPAEVFLGALAEDLIWTTTGTSPISGTYRYAIRRPSRAGTAGFCPDGGCGLG